MLDGELSTQEVGGSEIRGTDNADAQREGGDTRKLAQELPQATTGSFVYWGPKYGDGRRHRGWALPTLSKESKGT